MELVQNLNQNIDECGLKERQKYQKLTVEQKLLIKLKMKALSWQVHKSVL